MDDVVANFLIGKRGIDSYIFSYTPKENLYRKFPFAVYSSPVGRYLDRVKHNFIAVFGYIVLAGLLFVGAQFLYAALTMNRPEAVAYVDYIAYRYGILFAVLAIVYYFVKKRVRDNDPLGIRK
jgi:hypothetical protein